MLDEISPTHKMFNTLLAVIPHTFNVFLVLVVLLIIFSVLGIELFCFFKHGN